MGDEEKGIKGDYRKRKVKEKKTLINAGSEGKQKVGSEMKILW